MCYVPGPEIYDSDGGGGGDGCLIVLVVIGAIAGAIVGGFWLIA